MPACLHTRTPRWARSLPHARVYFARPIRFLSRSNNPAGACHGSAAGLAGLGRRQPEPQTSSGRRSLSPPGSSTSRGRSLVHLRLMESCLCSPSLRSASLSGREAEHGVAAVQQQLLRSSFVALTCCESQGSYLHRGLSHTAADCLLSPKGGSQRSAAQHDRCWSVHAAGASRASAALEDWSLWESSASARQPCLAAKASSAGSHRASRAPHQGHSTRVSDVPGPSASRHTSSRRRCTGGVHSGHSSGHSGTSSSGSGPSGGRWPFLFSDDLVPSSSHSPKRRPSSRTGPADSGTRAHGTPQPPSLSSARYCRIVQGI